MVGNSLQHQSNDGGGDEIDIKASFLNRVPARNMPKGDETMQKAAHFRPLRVKKVKKRPEGVGKS